MQVIAFFGTLLVFVCVFFLVLFCSVFFLFLFLFCFFVKEERVLHMKQIGYVTFLRLRSFISTYKLN